MKWHTYILNCADGSFYVGHTNSVEGRFNRHQAKTGVKHTAAHQPLDVAYSESFDSELDAIRRERQIKRWSRSKKKALIEGRVADLRKLSRSHDHARFSG